MFNPRKNWTVWKTNSLNFNGQLMKNFIII